MAIIQGNSGNIAGVNSKGQLLVSGYEEERIGAYIGHSGLIAALATAHAALMGFMWLLNPTNSAHRLRVRRIELSSTSAAVATASTRVTAERMSFTGTHQGALLPIARVDNAMPAPLGILTTSTTGITPVAGAPLYGFQLAVVVTAVGTLVPNLLEYEPQNQGGYPILAPGEGVVLRQADAGVTSDPRRLTINLAWEELPL